MKKSLYLFLAILLICSIYSACVPDVELPGTIYGVVADKATGEPIKSAGVELTPGGFKTITGSEGQFEFTELEPGQYSLLVTKTGYIDAVSSTIDVKAGQTAKGDIQLEKAATLKVVNDNREEISTLDFGSSVDDMVRSFSLLNDGTETLEWQLTATATWIESVSKTKGVLAAGAIQSLLITIDRSKLSSGVNKTTIHITSDNGNKQLTVTATNSFLPTTLNTYEPTDVKTTSATLHGEILTDGTPKYTERGFVYAETSKPTIDNCIKQVTSPITNSKTYSATVTDLIENKTYYVRAYAINGGKVAYSSNEVSFVAFGNALPKVTTKPIVEINRKIGKAVLQGEVTDIGDPAYTERGFVYGTTHNPTITNHIKVEVAGNGTGEYSVNISQLQLETIYYVRAYAINKVGIAYGEEQVIDMNVSPPSVTTNAITAISVDDGSATFNATITNIGDPAYTERGFVYSKSSNPTINSNKVIVYGSGEEGAYSKTISELDVNCTYYVRAYVIYSQGTIYGEEKSFVIQKVSVPMVITSSVMNVSYTFATVGGNVTNDGASIVTERGVCYSTISNPTISSYTESSGGGIGSFTVDLTDLSSGTTYYIRAYAINAEGVSYGEQKSFTTKTYNKPTVTTSSVSNITTSSASVGGHVTSDGGATILERGVCYSTSTNPTIYDHTIMSYGTTGSFTVDLDGLSASKTYYVRAYATNEVGTSYGASIKFTTKESSPTTGTENGYKYVDLGLSVKWATCNVGANNPEEYGKYFAWGETYSKSYYNGSSYTYTDNPTTLPMSADAARVNWGGNWRMPTMEELEELCSKCTWSWTTENGVNGYKITSKSNGHYIFLPAAGYRDLGSLYGAGDYGYYWSSSAYGANYSTTALFLYFYSTWKDRKNDYKAAGRSIRPVCP